MKNVLFVFFLVRCPISSILGFGNSTGAGIAVK